MMNTENFRFTTKNGGAWEYLLPPENADPVTVEMCRYADMRGIRRPVPGETEAGTVFRFPAEGYCGFFEALEAYPSGFARKVLLSCLEAFVSAEDYMLDPESLLTEPEYILWNRKEARAELLCLPGFARGRKQTFAEALSDLCGALLTEKARRCDRVCALGVGEALKAGIRDWKQLRQTAEGLPHSVETAVLLRAADGKVFSLHTGKNVVGRAEEAAVLHISDRASVSRKHACLEETDGTWKIVDLSLNHTCVNGKNLDKGTPAVLQSGDALYLAAEKFRFVC